MPSGSMIGTVRRSPDRSDEHRRAPAHDRSGQQVSRTGSRVRLPDLHVDRHIIDLSVEAGCAEGACGILGHVVLV